MGPRGQPGCYILPLSIVRLGAATIESICEGYFSLLWSPFMIVVVGYTHNLFHLFLLVDFLSVILCVSKVHTFINWTLKNTTLSNGYLGSRNDEERSEMRYVMRIAEFSESSNLWTQIALLGSPRSTPLSVSVQQSLSSVCLKLRLGHACWLDNESLSASSLSLLKYME
jgi:hypothetical protein